MAILNRNCTSSSTRWSYESGRSKSSKKKVVTIDCPVKILENPAKNFTHRATSVQVIIIVDGSPKGLRGQNGEGQRYASEIFGVWYRGLKWYGTSPMIKYCTITSITPLTNVTAVFFFFMCIHSPSLRTLLRRRKGFLGCFGVCGWAEWSFGKMLIGFPTGELSSAFGSRCWRAHRHTHMGGRMDGRLNVPNCDCHSRRNS